MTELLSALQPLKVCQPLLTQPQHRPQWRRGGCPCYVWSTRASSGGGSGDCLQHDPALHNYHRAAHCCWAGLLGPHQAISSNLQTNLHLSDLNIQSSAGSHHGSSGDSSLTRSFGPVTHWRFRSGNWDWHFRRNGCGDRSLHYLQDRSHAWNSECHPQCSSPNYLQCSPCLQAPLMPALGNDFSLVDQNAELNPVF